MFLVKKICSIYLSKKSLITFASFILFIILVFMPSTVLFSFPIDNDKIFITAHRGNSSKAPENTLSAINYAIKSKIDYAEIDVQETKDGQIILIHDNNFKRVCGYNKKTWEVTYEEIKGYDVGSHFHSKFKGEKIPTLEEALKTSKNKIKLNIEIKANNHDKNLVLTSLNIIRKENFSKNCIITSSNYNVLKQIRKLDPSIKIGYITHTSLKDLETLDVDIYSVNGAIIDKNFIEKAHRKGRQVHVWTINAEDSMVKYINLGVDNIITDHPNKLKKILTKRKSQTLLSEMLEF